MGNDQRTAKAASKVQSLWRKMKARKHYATLTGKMDQETAARKLQAKWRRRCAIRRPNPLVLAAQENPASKPITHERLLEIEAQILKKRSAYIPDVTGDPAAQALRIDELRRKAAEKYQGFLASRPRERAEVGRTYLHKEHTRQMIRALEGASWDKPMPYGICSAALLPEAERMHKERKASIARDIWASGKSGAHSVEHTGAAIEAATITVAVESHAEAEEADQLLWGLEADLGYDFSEKSSNVQAAKPASSSIFQTFIGR